MIYSLAILFKNQFYYHRERARNRLFRKRRTLGRAIPFATPKTGAAKT